MVNDKAKRNKDVRSTIVYQDNKCYYQKEMVKQIKEYLHGLPQL